MKPLDFAKALGLAVLVLALDLIVATAVITGWSLLVDTGHPESYYKALAPTLATWSTSIAGPLLMLGVVWWFSRRRPERNRFAFALTIWLAYVFLDGAVVAFQNFFTPLIAMVLGLKLFGALGGAMLAARENGAD